MTKQPQHTTTKQIKRIVDNMLVLKACNRTLDLFEYQRACTQGLSRHDLAAVKRVFEQQLIERG